MRACGHACGHVYVRVRVHVHCMHACMGARVRVRDYFKVYVRIGPPWDSRWTQNVKNHWFYCMFATKVFKMNVSRTLKSKTLIKRG